MFLYEQTGAKTRLSSTLKGEDYTHMAQQWLSMRLTIATRGSKIVVDDTTYSGNTYGDDATDNLVWMRFWADKFWCC